MDYLTDKLLSLLPPLNTDSNDVAINMSTLSEIDPRLVSNQCIVNCIGKMRWLMWPVVEAYSVFIKAPYLLPTPCLLSIIIIFCR